MRDVQIGTEEEMPKHKQAHKKRFPGMRKEEKAEEEYGEARPDIKTFEIEERPRGKRHAKKTQGICQEAYQRPKLRRADLRYIPPRRICDDRHRHWRSDSYCTNLAERKHFRAQV